MLAGLPTTRASERLPSYSECVNERATQRKVPVAQAVRPGVRSNRA